MGKEKNSPVANDERTPERAGARALFSVREALHVLIAAATWILFFYWWAIVLPQVRRDDAVVAALFIGVSSLGTVILTAAWVSYNIGIFRRKGPRRRLTPSAPAPDTDALGRRIAGPEGRILRASPVVVVAVDGDVKTIESGGAS